MLITYEEVTLRSTKRGKCLCGKHRVRSKTFYQTISPFNKKEDGEMKSRYDITPELREDIKDWKVEPITCDNCKKIKVEQDKLNNNNK